MPMVFACSVSHTPGIRAWADAPPQEQRERFYAGYERLRERLWDAEPEAILIVSSEHFANFFLDCMPAFAIGPGGYVFRADRTLGEDPAGIHPRRPGIVATVAECLLWRGR